MTKSSIQVGVFVFGLLLFPSTVFFLHIGSSYTLGIAALCCMVIVFELSGRRLVISRKALVMLYVVFGAIIAHLLFASPSGNFWMPRALFSIFVILLITVAANFAARRAVAMAPEAFDRLILRALLMLICLAFLSVPLRPILGPALNWRTPVTPFSEPSHFIIAFAPFAAYGFASQSSKLKLAIMAVAGVMVVQVGSATILVLVLLLTAVLLPVWASAVVLPAAAGIALTFLTSDYYLSRLAFWEGENLTALVYLQGLQTIGETLGGSNASGLGFQQLGSRDLGLEASKLIRALRQGEDSNILDGGFVAAKLFGEFGLLAIPLALGVVGVVIRSYFKIRRHRNGSDPMTPQRLFCHCCFYAYIIEFAFRGIGYFSIGGALIVMAALMLHIMHRREKDRYPA